VSEEMLIADPFSIPGINSNNMIAHIIRGQSICIQNCSIHTATLMY